MTTPLPMGLAESVAALKAEYDWRVDRYTMAHAAIDRTVALCAEAWGKEVARLEDFTRCAMAAGGQQVGTIAAQAARIAELEAQLTASHNAALERAVGECCKLLPATEDQRLFGNAMIQAIRALMTKE